MNKIPTLHIRSALALGLVATGAPRLGAQEAPPPPTYEIVIYGGTSAGVAAAVQAARMGVTAVVVAPENEGRLGGLSSGGLGQTDIGNKAAIGGVAREFYHRIARHYASPAAWRWQRRDEYRSGGQSRTERGEDTMWTFEPSAALQVFVAMVQEAGVEVHYGQRLDRRRGRGVVVEGAAIVALRAETGQVYRGRVFIDATYEGDLMAAAGVSYTVGREANALYAETLNGVQTRQATKHQLRPGIDPHVRPGDAASGLLPGIDPTGPGEEGGGDHRLQAFCFRMCLTDHPENRLPFAKPEGYREIDYELLLRNFEAGARVVPLHHGHMPNRKTDTNNNRGFSTDFIGQNYAYPEAGYAERERIVARHRTYQQGLMWTLANHPRVPPEIRREVSRWGLCRDEFVAGGGWQDQLYIREARRMVAPYVMTQHHCQGRELAEDVVGMAAYTMDSHNVQRYVDAGGHARNEGDVQVGGFPPYPISYRAIVPAAAECSNLLVPVCLSASHIAFGSIRMEPVFMVLGQSAATAAAQAIEAGVPVQQVDYPGLRARLLEDGQVLAWSPPEKKDGGRPAPPGLDPARLAGVVVDDRDAQLDGAWVDSTSGRPFVGAGYRHDNNAEKGARAARFEVRLPRPGRYAVALAYTAHPNRSTRTPVVVEHRGGTTETAVDQTRAPPAPGPFHFIGNFYFGEDKPAAVTVSNLGTDGYVIIDAVQFRPAAGAR